MNEEETINTKRFLGKALVVLIGIGAIIAPWFTKANLQTQIIITIVGIILLGLGFKK